MFFDRFYKADEARSRSSTGLGLSIAKELTERMGGTIEAGIQDGWFIVEIRFSDPGEQELLTSHICQAGY